MAQLCRVYLLVCSLLFFCNISFTVDAQEVSKKFVFCYENKSFPPHFFGESINVPNKNPGIMIDILRALDKKIDKININYIRQPWARCLNGLKQGTITAIVGSYSIKRASFSVYPTQNGVIDKTKAFDHVATCLIHSKKEKVIWNGKQFVSNKALSVAIPLGYSVKKKLESLNVSIYQTSSLDTAYELLKSNRVLMSIIDCNAKKIPEFATLIPLPIREHHGYLIVSKTFYRENKKLSNKIWQVLANIDKQKYRENYENKQ